MFAPCPRFLSRTRWAVGLWKLFAVFYTPLRVQSVLNGRCTSCQRQHNLLIALLSLSDWKFNVLVLRHIFSSLFIRAIFQTWKSLCHGLSLFLAPGICNLWPHGQPSQDVIFTSLFISRWHHIPFEKQLTAFIVIPSYHSKEACYFDKPLENSIYMQDSALQVISACSHYKQIYALSVMRFVSSRNCNRLFLRLWNISAANAH